LRAAGEADEYARRHAAHYRDAAEEANASFIGDGYDSAFETLDLERDNLRGALAWAAGVGEIEIETRIAVALRWYWVMRGDLHEARSVFEHAVAETVTAEPTLRAAARAHGGAIVFRLGELETARLWWEEALALYRDLGDVDGISRCIAELGSVAMASGQLDEAAARYLESAAIFEELGHEVRLAVALSNLGGIEGLRGNQEEAAAYTERALALQRSTGDRDGEAVSLVNLARTCISLGQHGSHWSGPSWSGRQFSVARRADCSRRSASRCWARSALPTSGSSPTCASASATTRSRTCSAEEARCRWQRLWRKASPDRRVWTALQPPSTPSCQRLLIAGL
jgi:tetratricopeptide (TPR) repeat protein